MLPPEIADDDTFAIVSKFEADEVSVPLISVNVPLTVFAVVNVTPAVLLMVTLLIKAPEIGHAE